MNSRNPTPSNSPQTDGLHLGELLKIVKLRRKLLYVFTALAIFGAIFRQVFYIPLYTAEAKLSIQKIENSPLQLALANLGAQQLDTSDRLKRYTDYLSSHEFFQAVAETLKFKEGYQLLNLNHPGEMGLTQKKFWQQFLATHFGHKEEKASLGPEPYLVPVEKLAAILAGMTQAEAVGSDIIRIHVTSLDPFTSMVLANTITEVFVKKTTERDYNEVTEVRKFIQDQLESTTERLKTNEAGLIEFKKRHNIISLSEEHSPLSSKMNTLETELESNRIKFQENHKLIDYYEAALGKAEKSILSRGAAGDQDAATTAVGRLRQELDTLRYKKVLMQAQGYSEDAWQMGEVNHQLDKVAADLREQLAHSGNAAEGDDVSMINPQVVRAKLFQLKEENKTLEMRIASMEKSRGELTKNLQTLPKDEQALLTLKRDVDLQFELYSSLKKKLQEVEIQQVALQSHVSTLERAELPPPAPRTHILIKILFSLLVGVFLGCSTGFLLEAVDPTIKHPADLERLEMINLGSIPHVEGSSMRQSLGVHTYRPDLLICKEKPESPASMAFKHVRAQLAVQRGVDGKPAQVITITSPERGDGKSFIAANLAVCMSQLEKRTLLIDADFRNPSAPWLFGYRETDGLSSLLTLKASLDEILLKDRAPHLDILPAGWTPANPSELIGNDKFQVLIAHLRTIYDYIIIDAPPAIAVVDASILANLSDTVIMTAGFRKTKKDAMIMALRRILMVSHRHIYSLLNNVWEIQEYTTYSNSRGEGANARAAEPIDSKSELELFERSLGRRKSA